MANRYSHSGDDRRCGSDIATDSTLLLRKYVIARKDSSMAEWAIIDYNHVVNLAGVTEALFNVDQHGQWIARLWLATGEERILRGDAVHQLRQLIQEQPHAGRTA
jgi:hypothetical protein